MTLLELVAKLSKYSVDMTWRPIYRDWHIVVHSIPTISPLHPAGRDKYIAFECFARDLEQGLSWACEKLCIDSPVMRLLTADPDE